MVAVTLVAVAAALTLFWPRGTGVVDAPGGMLTDAGGRSQTLGAHLAPVTLVHFWATWCPPCLTEVPALDRLAEEYSTYPDFRVLMVAVDDDVATVATFRGGRAGDMLYDPDWDVAHRYGTRALPETYLVVGGKVIEKWEGMVDWDDPGVRRRLEGALEAAGAEVAALAGGPPARG
jgi:thiol-disulfide isomerase/thioredoxin